ncbi:MAG: hypothetical protein M3R63_16825 [Actinomycetota bacterium]|nr:hypothetical protein [Actinomycetota bacterium]
MATATGWTVVLLQLVRKVVEQQIVGLAQVVPSRDVHVAEATPTTE